MVATSVASVDQQRGGLVAQHPFEACADRASTIALEPRSLNARASAPPRCARVVAQQPAHIIGVSVSETIAETTTAIGQRQRELAEHAARRGRS